MAALKVAKEVKLISLPAMESDADLRKTTARSGIGI
jgi:hypothetical protein